MAHGRQEHTPASASLGDSFILPGWFARLTAHALVDVGRSAVEAVAHLFVLCV